MKEIEAKYVISQGGISLMGGLFLVFITLKLTHFIDWSWWWVTAPLWVPWAICFGFFVLFGIIAMIIALIIWLIVLLGD